MLALAVMAVLGAPKMDGPQMPFRAMIGPVIIAHRGGSLEAPENTVASIKHGVAAGADWQELDVTLSKDGKLSVIHDDTVDRTTNGHGAVTAMTFDKLRKLDAGNPKWADYVVKTLEKQGVPPPSFGTKYKGEKLPSLMDVLKVPDAQLMVEMKKYPNATALANATVDEVRKASMEGRVILASFEQDLLLAANLRDSGLPLLGLAEDEAGIKTMLNLPITVLGVNVENAEKALELAPKKVAVWIWTVYSPAEAKRLADLGVHGIITDAPTKILGELRKEPGIMVEK